MYALQVQAVTTHYKNDTIKEADMGTACSRNDKIINAYNQILSATWRKQKIREI